MSKKSILCVIKMVKEIFQIGIGLNGKTLTIKTHGTFRLNLNRISEMNDRRSYTRKIAHIYFFSSSSSLYCCSLFIAATAVVVGIFFFIYDAQEGLQLFSHFVETISLYVQAHIFINKRKNGLFAMPLFKIQAHKCYAKRKKRKKNNEPRIFLRLHRKESERY